VRASLHHAQLAEHISAYDSTSVQALAGLHANGLAAGQGHAVINRMIDQQAFTMSADDLFRLSALVFVLLIGVVWLARPAKKAVVPVVGVAD
jgi:DHA2 family multidrug resistance protein